MISCDLSSPDATCPRCGFRSKIRGAIRRCRKPAQRTCGPGCHLKRLLGWMAIKDDGTCKCDEHASQMDAWGPDGCKQNIGTILGWLRAASKKRFPLVPFVDAAGVRMIRRAIAAAEQER